ncbi:MAG: AraC family transcriptional regulator [Deltaproteobacteria bacterium]|nr:AraC family transcriptional regulator [Nannocystaceae bacterium]
MPDLPDLAKNDYVVRVNRAIDHVTRNLAEPLRLDDVAAVACFSSYHFHRIFRALTGETLASFIKRLRLERAVYMLSHGPKTSLTEIALACGFASSSDFSRSFRSHYGVPPRVFDVRRFRTARREQLETSLPAGARDKLQRLPPGDNPDGFAITLRKLPARRVGYRRVLNPYAGGVVEAVAALMTWATARGLAGGQWLGYQWDDPEIVPLAQCRYDVGVEIPTSAVVGDEASIVELPAMTVAELAIAGPIDLEMRALDWIYTTWLPSSGYAPAHQPCFEAWNGAPFAHGAEHFDLRVQLPVTRL